MRIKTLASALLLAGALSANLGYNQPLEEKVAMAAEPSETSNESSGILEFYDNKGATYDFSLKIIVMNVEADATLSVKRVGDNGYKAVISSKDGKFKYSQSTEGFVKDEKLHPLMYQMETKYSSWLQKKETQEFIYGKDLSLEKIIYRENSSFNMQTTTFYKKALEKDMTDFLSAVLQQLYNNTQGINPETEHIIRNGKVANMEFTKHKKDAAKIKIVDKKGNELDIKGFTVSFDEDGWLKELYIKKTMYIIKDFKLKLKSKNF
ncbi:MAG: hypothetical protein ABIB71_08850 [Candidatus Woesearchaeota archaeon]